MTQGKLSYDDARRLLETANHGDLKRAVAHVIQTLGVKGETARDAVMDWSAGAQNAVVQVLPEQIDPETSRYLAAWSGLLHNQRGVLVFHTDPNGMDSTYAIPVSSEDPVGIRTQLDQLGLRYRTIVPQDDTYHVVIYDPARRKREAVARFARSHNATVQEAIGTGEYIGGSSKAAARAEYRGIISGYEREGNEAGGAGDLPEGGGRLHDDPAYERGGGGPERTPKGGSIVRGLAYKGGHFKPNQFSRDKGLKEKIGQIVRKHLQSLDDDTWGDFLEDSRGLIYSEQNDSTREHKRAARAAHMLRSTTFDFDTYQELLAGLDDPRAQKYYTPFMREVLDQTNAKILESHPDAFGGPVDWRPDESIPEDYYAMSRNRRGRLIRLAKEVSELGKLEIRSPQTVQEKLFAEPGETAPMRHAGAETEYDQEWANFLHDKGHWGEHRKREAASAKEAGLEPYRSMSSRIRNALEYLAEQRDGPGYELHAELAAEALNGSWAAYQALWDVEADSYDDWKSYDDPDYGPGTDNYDAEMQESLGLENPAWIAKSFLRSLDPEARERRSRQNANAPDRSTREVEETNPWLGTRDLDDAAIDEKYATKKGGASRSLLQRIADLFRGKEESHFKQGHPLKSPNTMRPDPMTHPPKPRKTVEPLQTDESDDPTSEEIAPQWSKEFQNRPGRQKFARLPGDNRLKNRYTEEHYPVQKEDAKEPGESPHIERRFFGPQKLFEEPGQIPDVVDAPASQDLLNDRFYRFNQPAGAVYGFLMAHRDEIQNWDLALQLYQEMERGSIGGEDEGAEPFSAYEQFWDLMLDEGFSEAQLQSGQYPMTLEPDDLESVEAYKDYIDNTFPVTGYNGLQDPAHIRRTQNTFMRPDDEPDGRSVQDKREDAERDEIARERRVQDDLGDLALAESYTTPAKSIWDKIREVFGGGPKKGSGSRASLYGPPRVSAKKPAAEADDSDEPQEKADKPTESMHVDPKTPVSEEIAPKWLRDFRFRKKFARGDSTQKKFDPDKASKKEFFDQLGYLHSIAFDLEEDASGVNFEQRLDLWDEILETEEKYRIRNGEAPSPRDPIANRTASIQRRLMNGRAEENLLRAGGNYELAQRVSRQLSGQIQGEDGRYYNPSNVSNRGLYRGVSGLDEYNRNSPDYDWHNDGDYMLEEQNRWYQDIDEPVLALNQGRDGYEQARERIQQMLDRGYQFNPNELYDRWRSIKQAFEGDKEGYEEPPEKIEFRRHVVPIRLHHPKRPAVPRSYGPNLGRTPDPAGPWSRFPAGEAAMESMEELGQEQTLMGYPSVKGKLGNLGYGNIAADLQEEIDNPHEKRAYLEELEEEAGQKMTPAKGDTTGLLHTSVGVAQFIENLTKSRLIESADDLGGADESKKAERAQILHFIANALDETSYQLTKGEEESGSTWYGPNLVRTRKLLNYFFENDPEFQAVAGTFGDAVENDPETLSPRWKLWNYLLAASSYGNTPVVNMTTATEMLREGIELDPDNPFGNMSRYNRRNKKNNAGAMGSLEGHARALEKLIDQFGEEGAADWLLEEHPLTELAAVHPPAKTLPGGKGAMYPGAYILGPKGGAFMLNQTGVVDDKHLTKDLWWSRSWNRIMGSLMTTKKMKGTNKRVPDIQDSPRSNVERRRMDKAAKIAAGDLGLNVEEFQAVLWYFEQQLWKALGAPAESNSYESAIQAKIEGRGLGIQTASAPRDEGSQRRENAVSAAISRRTRKSRAIRQRIKVIRAAREVFQTAPS